MIYFHSFIIIRKQKIKQPKRFAGYKAPQDDSHVDVISGAFGNSNKLIDDVEKALKTDRKFNLNCKEIISI
jgi:hypothetical protein